MKCVSFPKPQITSKRYCQDVNLVFEKDTAHNKCFFSSSITHLNRKFTVTRHLFFRVPGNQPAKFAPKSIRYMNINLNILQF